MNYVAGNIAGWAVGPTPAKYTPSGLVVPRTKYPATMAVFAYGNNTIVFPWNSHTGSTTVNIPMELSLDDDLILYLTQNTAVLLTACGVVISESTVATGFSDAMMAKDGHSA